MNPPFHFSGSLTQLGEVSSMIFRVPIFLTPIVEELEKEFILWRLKEVRDYGKKIYITFEGSIFNDTHLKIACRIAKNHNFSLIQFGILPRDDKLLVTFVLAPRRR
jgi:hypothetical protein